MNPVSPEKLKEFERWVQEDWPNDPMLKEIHLILLIRQEELKGLSDAELVAYFKALPKPTSKHDAA